MLILDIKTGVKQRSHKLQLTAYAMAYSRKQPKITIDPDKHIYYIAGKAIPSVTTILKEVGLIDDRWFTDGSSERGTDVHEFIELLDRDRNVTIPNSYKGFTEAYFEFTKNNNLSIKEIELSVYDSRLKVCGRIDRVFEDGSRDIRIGTLKLSSDGKYKFKEYQRLDRVWKACVEVYNYKVGR